MPKHDDLVKVLNLRTNDISYFSCEPIDAVMAAHAQSKGDWNTWDYAKKYRSIVEIQHSQRGGAHATIMCGDFATIVRER